MRRTDVKVVRVSSTLTFYKRGSERGHYKGIRGRLVLPYSASTCRIGIETMTDRCTQTR